MSISWREAYNYAAQVEDHWDRVMYEKDMEEEKYLQGLDEHWESIISEFRETKQEYKYLFEEKMWWKIERAVTSYSEEDKFTTETTLSDIITKYIENGDMWEDYFALYPHSSEAQDLVYEINEQKFYELF